MPPWQTAGSCAVPRTSRMQLSERPPNTPGANRLGKLPTSAPSETATGPSGGHFSTEFPPWIIHLPE